MEEKQTFESKMKRLDEIVSLVEKESLTLDQSIPLYEEGTKLINELEVMLNDVEDKIVKIIDKNK